MMRAYFLAGLVVLVSAAACGSSSSQSGFSSGDGGGNPSTDGGGASFDAGFGSIDGGFGNVGDAASARVGEVYAHSASTLYKLEPFSKSTTIVGDFSGCDSEVIDIALDKD